MKERNRVCVRRAGERGRVRERDREGGSEREREREYVCCGVSRW